jgi:hypothetical protein
VRRTVLADEARAVEAEDDGQRLERDLLKTWSYARWRNVE